MSTIPAVAGTTRNPRPEGTRQHGWLADKRTESLPDGCRSVNAHACGLRHNRGHDSDVRNHEHSPAGAGDQHRASFPVIDTGAVPIPKTLCNTSADSHCNTCPDADSNAIAGPDSCPYSTTHTYSYAISNANRDCHADSHGDTNPFTQPNAHTCPGAHRHQKWLCDDRGWQLECRMGCRDH